MYCFFSIDFLFVDFLIPPAGTSVCVCQPILPLHDFNNNSLPIHLHLFYYDSRGELTPRYLQGSVSLGKYRESESYFDRNPDEKSGLSIYGGGNVVVTISGWWNAEKEKL